MMIKFLFALLLIPSFVHAIDPWSDTLKVKWVSPTLHLWGGNYFITLEPIGNKTNALSSTTCPQTGSSINLQAPGDDDKSLFIVKSWLATLLTAVDGGKFIKLYWTSTVCTAVDLIICTEAAHCQSPD